MQHASRSESRLWMSWVAVCVMTMGMGSNPTIAQDLGTAVAPQGELWHFDGESLQLRLTVPPGGSPRYFLLARPMRIAIDFPSSIPVQPQTIAYGGAVEQLTISSQANGDLRIVMQLRSGVELQPKQVNVQQIDPQHWLITPLVVPGAVPIAESGSVPANSLVNGSANTSPNTSPHNSIFDFASSPPTVSSPPTPGTATALPQPTPSAPATLTFPKLPSTPIAPPAIATNSAPSRELPPPITSVPSTSLPIAVPSATPIPSTPTVPVPILDFNPTPRSTTPVPVRSSQPQRIQTSAPSQPIPPTVAVSSPKNIFSPENAQSPDPDPEPLKTQPLMPSSSQVRTIAQPSAPEPRRVSPTKIPAPTSTPPVQQPISAQFPAQQIPAQQIPAQQTSAPRPVPASAYPPDRKVPKVKPLDLSEVEVLPLSLAQIAVPPSSTAIQGSYISPSIPASPSSTAPGTIVSPSANPSPGSSIIFGQPLTPIAAKSRTLPKGTAIPLRYTGRTPIEFATANDRQEVLIVDEDVNSPQGQVVIPAGSQILGHFETHGRSGRFVVQTVAWQQIREPFSGSFAPSQPPTIVPYQVLVIYLDKNWIP